MKTLTSKLTKLKALLLCGLALAFATPAHADTFGVFPNSGIDYTQFVIVLTGKSLGIQNRCGFDFEMHQAILIHNGPAIKVEIGVFDTDLQGVPEPGTMFTAAGQSNCDVSSSLVTLTRFEVPDVSAKP